MHSQSLQTLAFAFAVFFDATFAAPLSSDKALRPRQWSNDTVIEARDASNETVVVRRQDENSDSDNTASNTGNGKFKVRQDGNATDGNTNNRKLKVRQDPSSNAAVSDAPIPTVVDPPAISSIIEVSVPAVSAAKLRARQTASGAAPIYPFPAANTASVDRLIARQIATVAAGFAAPVPEPSVIDPAPPADFTHAVNKLRARQTASAIPSADPVPAPAPEPSAVVSENAESLSTPPAASASA